jgi:hypothetical protein
MINHDKKVITSCQDTIDDMKAICKEYAIKDADLMSKINNVSTKLKNSIKYERKNFNIGKLNEENDFFTSDTMDYQSDSLLLNREKLFKTEQNLKVLIEKLVTAQKNPGKGINFIHELGI